MIEHVLNFNVTSVKAAFKQKKNDQCKDVLKSLPPYPNPRIPGNTNNYITTDEKILILSIFIFKL